MQYQQVDGAYILRIDKGELVHATLNEFCTQHQITNALVSAIGAVEFVRCGIYDLPERTYQFKEYNQMVEVVAYQGNIMQKEAGLFVHAHSTFSDYDNNVFGGHVDEMRVGVVLEVTLTPLSSKIERHFDEATGLYLMDLQHKS